MQFDFNVLLAPAVIAAIVSASVTWFVSYHKQSLDYITAERANWRKRIKETMVDLVAGFGNQTATAIALQKIKSELNPYGQSVQTIITSESVLGKKRELENDDYYFKDGHLWSAIAIYEQNPNDMPILQSLLTQLEYMLKFDWERSKGEILNEHKWLIPPFLLSLGGLICLAVPIWGQIVTATGHQQISYLICGFLIVIFNILPYYSVVKNLNGAPSFLCFAPLFIILIILSFLLVATSSFWYSLALIVFVIAFATIAYASIRICKKRFEYIHHCKKLSSTAKPISDDSLPPVDSRISSN